MKDYLRITTVLCLSLLFFSEQEGGDVYAQSTPHNYSSIEKDWPTPVMDEHHYTYFLADVLEYRPSSDESIFKWDVEGWHGGDYNRLWFKSEGERDTAFKADYDIDLQLLYGRFLKRYFDLQVGARVETQKYYNANVTRGLAVIGIEGLIPYKWDFESSLFISQKGDVSGRASLTRDFMLTQKWILQGRVATNIAAQKVERFTIGTGLNNIELGARLRYEIHREYGPYIGISYDRSFYDTAKMVRQQGGNPEQLRFVIGMRLWH